MSYSKPSISNYNASPPPDDASQISANVIRWSNHITKIGDPLKSYIDAVNNATEAAWNDLGSTATTSDGAALVGYKHGGSTGTFTTGATATTLQKVADVGALNILAFDATIDATGATDVSAKIQAAIDSLPLNTADTGVLSPKGFSNGGEIYIPPGRYKVASKISLNRGVNIRGAGREATQILSFVDDSVFQYTDAGRYIQDEITIKDLSIWQDASVTPTQGAGIDLIDGTANPDSIQVAIENVIIEGTYDGIRLAAGVGCSIQRVNILQCVRYGIHLAQISTSTTSTTLMNCYTHLNGSHGVYIEAASYVNLVGCASDSNTGYGYYLDSVNGCGSFSCGAEQNTVGGMYLKDTLSCFIQLHIVSQAGLVHGISIDNANGVTLANCDFLSDAGTTGYGVNFVTPKHVLVLGPSYTGGYATNKFSSADYALTLTGAAFVKGGDTAVWTFGNTSTKDTTAQLAVSGNTESTVDTGIKSLVTFTAAGASRNNALSSQVATANTAVTYPLVNGHYIPNASKGAASTITRCAGQYIQQQTQGGTANANVMIDAGVGTVPAGNWSVYSDSTRDSVFKGPVRIGSAGGTAPFVSSGSGTPEGAVTAPIGSLFMRTDGSTGTSLYVKESGTGNTGWVPK